MSVTAAQLIEAVRESGATLRLVGEDIKVKPASVVPAELIQSLREQKHQVVEALAGQRIESMSEVRQLAHKYFDVTRFDPEEHPMPSAPPGEDPMVLRGTDKGKFFRKAEGWRECWPKTFEGTREVSSDYHADRDAVQRVSIQESPGGTLSSCPLRPLRTWRAWPTPPQVLAVGAGRKLGPSEFPRRLGLIGNSLGLFATTKPPARLPRASIDIRFCLPHPTPLTTT